LTLKSGSFIIALPKNIFYYMKTEKQKMIRLGKVVACLMSRKITSYNLHSSSSQFTDTEYFDYLIERGKDAKYFASICRSWINAIKTEEECKL
jgi:hypothetical protein